MILTTWRTGNLLIADHFKHPDDFQLTLNRVKKIDKTRNVESALIIVHSNDDDLYVEERGTSTLESFQFSPLG